MGNMASTQAFNQGNSSLLFYWLLYWQKSACWLISNNFKADNSTIPVTCILTRIVSLNKSYKIISWNTFYSILCRQFNITVAKIRCACFVLPSFHSVGRGVSLQLLDSTWMQRKQDIDSVAVEVCCGGRNFNYRYFKIWINQTICMERHQHREVTNIVLRHLHVGNSWVLTDCIFIISWEHWG